MGAAVLLFVGYHAGLALVFETIAFPGDGQDMGVMQQAIQQCGGERRVLGKGMVPLSKGQIAGDDQAPFPIPRGDDLEEQVGLLTVHGQVADFVDDQ